MLYSQLETIVRANVNSASATVSGVIDDAIYYLGNFFSNKKIDATQSTTIGQAYLTRPTRCLKVEYLKIGDVVYDRIEEKDIEETEEWELEKYIEKDDGKVYLYPTPTAVAAAIIHYKSGYTPLAGVAGATCDVQDGYLPLVSIIATWFYWLTIAGQTGTQRELFPDMTPEEAMAMAKTWEERFKLLLKSIRTNQI